MRNRTRAHTHYTITRLHTRRHARARSGGATKHAPHYCTAVRTPRARARAPRTDFQTQQETRNTKHCTLRERARAWMLHGRGDAPHITNNNNNNNRCGQMIDAHPDSTPYTRHSSSRAQQTHAARGTQLGRRSRLGRRSSAACTCTCRAPPAIHTLDMIQSLFPYSCSTEPKTASNRTPRRHGTAGRCGFRQCGAVTGTDSGERGKQLAGPASRGRAHSPPRDGGGAMCAPHCWPK